MSEELLNCPFCGIHPFQNIDSDLPEPIAVCDTTGCPLENVRIPWAKWNRRSLPEQVKALADALRHEMHCVECGETGCPCDDGCTSEAALSLIPLDPSKEPTDGR